jgi:hypothetical protein
VGAVPKLVTWERVPGVTARLAIEVVAAAATERTVVIAVRKRMVKE